MRSTRTGRGLALLASVTLIVALFGGTADARTKTTVKVTKVPGVGKVLAASNRHTLYTLTDTSGAAVECTGACASAWPPYTVSTAEVKAPKHLKSLGTTGDAHQVTWKKLPLYTYAADPGPKVANGDGLMSFGGTWKVVKVTKQAKKSASTSTTAKSTSRYGGY